MRQAGKCIFKAILFSDECKERHSLRKVLAIYPGTRTSLEKSKAILRHVTVESGFTRENEGRNHGENAHQQRFCNISHSVSSTHAPLANVGWLLFPSHKDSKSI